MYSLTGHEARILEVVFDKGKLRVRKTDHFKFKQEDPKTFDLYLRWMMSIPKHIAMFASDAAVDLSSGQRDSDGNSTEK